MKNKKAQLTFMVVIVATLLFGLMFASASYISSISLRSDKVLLNRQMTEFSKGSILYATSYMKTHIDFEGNPRTVDYDNDGAYNTYGQTISQSLSGNKYATMNSVVSRYFDPAEDPNLYESFHKKTIDETVPSLAPGGKVSKVIHLNNAQDVCYQVNWSGGAKIKVEFNKVKESSANPVPNRTDRDVYTDAQYYEDYPNPSTSWVVLPVESTSGQIGEVPSTFSNSGSVYNTNECNDSLDNAIPAEVFYTPSPDPNLTRLASGNGYGPYRITVTNTGSSTATNLQLKVLYNRLSYRTFKITSDVKFGQTYGEYEKDNVSAILKAEFPEDETDVTPKFKIIRWIEGAE